MWWNEAELELATDAFVLFLVTGVMKMILRRCAEAERLN
jgi:hypothetical protein